MGEFNSSPHRKLSEDALQHILQEHRKWVSTNHEQGELADLSHANLTNTILSDLDLRNANLSHAIFCNAKLHGTCLKDTDLQHADLTDSQGLIVGQLAGTNLSSAKLPKEFDRFHGLTQVENISRSAKTIFISILLGCAYSWLTIFSTTDVQLLLNSASKPLPIIQTPIQIVGFYYVAPIILVATFVYFQLYLNRLWKYFANLPAIFPDGQSLDEKAYPWLLNSILTGHIPLLRTARPPGLILELLTSIFLGWCIVPLTIVLFWILSLQRHDWRLTSVLLLVIAFAILSAWWSYCSARRTLRHQRSKTKASIAWKLGIIGLLVLLAGFISDGAINGVKNERNEAAASVLPHRKVIPQWLPYFLGAHAFLDFQGEEVSTIPDYARVLPVDEQKPFVRGARLSNADLRHLSAINSFFVNADLRDAMLQSANLNGAQLQNAQLMNAFLDGASLVSAKLQRADLRDARLKEADLTRANLQRADLRKATLHGAMLRNAELQGAILSEAELPKAALNHAQLQSTSDTGGTIWKTDLYQAKLFNADLSNANLQGAYLVQAIFHGASLHDADLQDADLTDAQFNKSPDLNRRANLSRAQLQNASLNDTQFESAILRDANLQKVKSYKVNFTSADLTGAKLQQADLDTAVLRNTNLRGANLREANLKGADLQFADLENTDLRGAVLEGVRGLTQKQLDQACADQATILPSSLSRPKPCSTHR